MRNRTWKAMRAVGLSSWLIGVFVLFPALNAEAMHAAFAPGDLFVSLRSGQVLWLHPDGSLNRVLMNAVPGKAEGMAFDAAGNLYVTHYCADLTVCYTGNGVEKFTANGMSAGSFGSGYNCNPESIVFDAAGRAYVGLSDCTGDVLLFNGLGALQQAFHVMPDQRGATRVDLGADGCTLFYTSQGPNVKRFNVCSNAQLQDFNAASLPGGPAYGVRVLPDGGVLVASFAVIARLDRGGRLLQTYDVPGEQELWLGLDEIGDGTFWASNYGSSNVYRFDLATGRVLASFSAGTPTTTVKDVLVHR